MFHNFYIRQTTSRNRVPFKLSIKKKLTVNQRSNERAPSKDISLLSILQKQTARPNRNIKLVRDPQKVEPGTFYHQSEVSSNRRRPAGDKKNKINFKLKKNDHQK